MFGKLAGAWLGSKIAGGNSGARGAALGYGAVGAQSVVMRLGVVDDGQSTLPTVAPPQQTARTGGSCAASRAGPNSGSEMVRGAADLPFATAPVSKARRRLK